MVGSIIRFVGNLLLFPTMKEFWKSVKNWQSYRHEFGVQFFWDTVWWWKFNVCCCLVFGFYAPALSRGFTRWWRPYVCLFVCLSPETDGGGGLSRRPFRPHLLANIYCCFL